MNGHTMETLRRSFGRSLSGNAALRFVLVLALGAPLLGGCAVSHVGNTWQCPLVQGQPCVSVADIDPAGAGAQRTGAREGNGGAWPDTADRSVPVSETPLYRTESVTKDEANDTAAQRSRSGCRAGCRPFAWLRRLGRHGIGAPPDAGVGEAHTDTGAPPEMPHAGTAAVDDLRTPEVIGRIWIASYVDAHGVYHEARWVRVVFEAAGWKYP